MGSIFDLENKTRKKVEEQLNPLINELEGIRTKNKRLQKRILLIKILNNNAILDGSWIKNIYDRKSLTGND